MPSLTIGRAISSFGVLYQVIGTFTADFNHTHIYNPRWPPHAKFHSGQTMSMALILPLASMYYTWRTSDLTNSANRAISAKAELSDAWTSTVFLSIYWITQMMAFVYPGVSWADPEFHDTKNWKGPAPQFYIEILGLAINGLGYWLEKRRLIGVALGQKDL
jgi:hypothetical protein